MPKRAISVTLDVDNLAWLRAQAGGGRHVSRILNELVGEARAAGRHFGAPRRSIAGTVDLRNYEPERARRDVRGRLDAPHAEPAADPDGPAQPDAGRGPAGSQ